MCLNLLTFSKIAFMVDGPKVQVTLATGFVGDRLGTVFESVLTRDSGS
jgi:hypothetical protein